MLLNKRPSRKYLGESPRYSCNYPEASGCAVNTRKFLGGGPTQLVFSLFQTKLPLRIAQLRWVVDSPSMSIFPSLRDGLTLGWHSQCATLYRGGEKGGAFLSLVSKTSILFLRLKSQQPTTHFRRVPIER